MADKERLLSADEARSLLRYEPETGLLFWRRMNPATARNGGRAGTDNGLGRICLTINGVSYQAHRVIWLIVHGEWPRHVIDHINGIPSDNRLHNLRDVPQSVNLQNVRRKRVDSLNSYAGIYRKGKKFGAHIYLNRVRINLGLFLTEVDAYAAYLKAKRELHEGCSI